MGTLHIEEMKNKYWIYSENGDEYVEKVIEDANDWSVVKANNMRAEKYFDVPASFDIETTSFRGDDERKYGTMYIWMFGVNGLNVVGRTWNEFGELLSRLDNEIMQEFETSLIIYVHNLSFEFQFIRKLFEWDKVFSLKERKPIYACAGYFEFRCSYLLSGLSLAKTGEQLQSTELKQFQKKVGDLDYSVKRHSLTPMTDTEMGYCLNDINVVQAYIAEKIKNDGNIAEIPLTNTGYVRKYCREQTLPENDKKSRLEYRALMKSLKIHDTEEYNQIIRAFMGGFTHASLLWSGKILTSKDSSFKSEHYFEDGICSIDIASSYPFCMCCLYFPMTPWKYIGTIDNNKELYDYLDGFCCLFDAEFEDLKPKLIHESPLSSSKCHCDNAFVNNGRIISADVCRTTLTELDWKTISNFYTWGSVRIFNLRISTRGRLPKPLVSSILKFYADKTTLKGVEGKEIEYLLSKGMVNSAYGMMVTAIIRMEKEYDVSEEEWLQSTNTVEAGLGSYNCNFNRFLSYSWGVWVTAHARRRLFSAIEEFGVDYVYSDTDSVKGVNFAKHEEWIKKENERVIRLLKSTSKALDLPIEQFMPKNKNGKTCPLGVWDTENGYNTFKTYGAKRYMYEEKPDGHFNFTISGLNKKVAVPYLLEKYDNDTEVVFNLFQDGFYIPEGFTGKLTSTYIDDEFTVPLTDYTGVTALITEESAINLEPQGYYMSIPYSYLQILEGVKEDNK